MPRAGRQSPTISLLRNRRFGLDSQSILVLSNVAVTLLSVVIIGLAAHNIVYVKSPQANSSATTIGWNVTFNDTESSLTRVVDYLPQDIRLGSYWLMLSWGVGGFILNLLIGGLLAWRHAQVWKAEGREGRINPLNDLNKTPATQITLAASAICFVWSLAATAYAFTQWQSSGKFDPSEDLFLQNGRYSSARGQGFFTPDSWNCQYEDYVVDVDIQNNINGYCIEGTSLRVVTLATTILGAFLLISLVWRTKARSVQKVQAERGFVEEMEVQDERVMRGRSRHRTPSRQRESMAPTIVANEKEEDRIAREAAAMQSTPAQPKVEV